MVGLVTRSPSPAPRRRFSAPSQKGSAYFILVPISCEIAEKTPLYTAHAWTRPSTPIFCAASGSLSAEYLSWTGLRPNCLSPPIRRGRPPTITRHTLDDRRRRRRTNWPREIPETANALRDFPASDTREPGRSSSNSFPAPPPSSPDDSVLRKPTTWRGYSRGCTTGCCGRFGEFDRRRHATSPAPRSCCGAHYRPASQSAAHRGRNTSLAGGLIRCRATEMDVTMIGLQNAGKTSLLRVLAVSFRRRNRLCPS